MGNTALPRFGDTKLDQLTNRVEIALNDLESKLLAGAVIITQAFNSTDNRVYHGLRRVPIGYFVVRKAFAVDIIEGLVPETIDRFNYITLRATSAGAGNISIAVF